MAPPQPLVNFLRALVAARKSLRLYPPGSPGAGAWLARLRGTLDALAAEGLVARLGLTRDRFVWTGGELAVPDEALDALRRDLQARGIAEFCIEPATADGELLHFLDLLNQSTDSVRSAADGRSFLRDRGVVHITVGGIGRGTAGDLAATGSDAGGSEPGEALLGAPDADPLIDGLVAAILEAIDERLSALAYDRQGLTAWLEEVAAARGVAAVYEALRMLGEIAEGAGDREVRTRTALEAVLRLAEPALRPLLTDWLVPRAGTDLTAFNLLTQMTEDDLGMVVRLVPTGQLVALTSELLEFPWEPGKRQRLLEAITWRLREPAKGEPGDANGHPLVDDPRLAEFRRELTEAMSPDVVLERSADVLLVLVAGADAADEIEAAVDAIDDVVAEALTQGKVELATRVLEEVGAVEGAAGREAAAAVRRKAGARTHVARLVDLVRQGLAPARLDVVARYLQIAGPESVEAFVDLLGEEQDRRVRLRMCDALARLGPPVVPAMAARLRDPRWFVARNAVYTLGRIGHGSAAGAVVSALAHPHPRVRREAIRAAGVVGVGQVAGALGRLVTDPDRDVQRAAIAALGTPGNEAGIPPLREALARPPQDADDEETKREAMRALATIGTPGAVQVLKEIAERRVRFWGRAERRLRDIAVEVLGGQGAAPPAGAPEGGHAP